MTESDWLTAKDPDAMLRLIAARFSIRQWNLLACGIVRRAWDLFPDGPIRDAVEWAERSAGNPDVLTDRQRLTAGLEDAVRSAADAARAAERQIVLAADPDGDPEVYEQNAIKKANPAADLLLSAGRNARSAVRSAGEAVERAAEAVAVALAARPGPAQVERTREIITDAVRIRAVAVLHEAHALKLAARADEMAERTNGRNAGHRAAVAAIKVTQETTRFGYRNNDLYAEKEAADRKALGRLLHELAGNPFTGFRFEPEWRTSTVVGLARAIDADRAFDRMPILADALLDADCDAEAVLRHCRGTEAHAADLQHVRGCWVIDLILERETEFFAAPPLPATSRAKQPRRMIAPRSPLFDVARRTRGSDG